MPICRKDRSSLLGAKPKADMEVLNQALEELVESLRPSAEELEKQDKAFLKVGILVNIYTRPLQRSLLLSMAYVHGLAGIPLAECTLAARTCPSVWLYSKLAQHLQQQ